MVIDNQSTFPGVKSSMTRAMYSADFPWAKDWPHRHHEPHKNNRSQVSKENDIAKKIGPFCL